MTGNFSINSPSANLQVPSIIIILSVVCMLVFAFSLASEHPITASSSINNELAQADADNIQVNYDTLQIVKVVPFNNTVPTSVAVDALRNLVYVSVNSGYPYNYTLSLCEKDATSQQVAIVNVLSACSAVYALDGDSGLIMLST